MEYRVLSDVRTGKLVQPSYMGRRPLIPLRKWAGQFIREQRRFGNVA